MINSSVVCLKQIVSFLKTQANKITLNNEKVPTCTIQNKSVTGFINIILTLIKDSKAPLLGSNSIEEAEIRQWLEYCMTYVANCNNNQATNQILGELNNFLRTRTYFVGNSLTIADIALFYMLQDYIEKSNYIEKEKFLNVSRWFDNLQQNDSIRKDKSLIDFSTIYLSSVAVH